MTEEMISENIKVLVLCPYPHGAAAGQRFRYERYLDVLNSRQIEMVIRPFLTDQAMEVLYERGHYLVKTWNVLVGFCARILLMFRVFNYDYIFVFREASPLCPPIFGSLEILTL